MSDIISHKLNTGTIGSSIFRSLITKAIFNIHGLKKKIPATIGLLTQKEKMLNNEIEQENKKILDLNNGGILTREHGRLEMPTGAPHPPDKYEMFYRVKGLPKIKQDLNINRLMNNPTHPEHDTLFSGGDIGLLYQPEDSNVPNKYDGYLHYRGGLAGIYYSLCEIAHLKDYNLAWEKIKSTMLYQVQLFLPKYRKISGLLDGPIS